MTSYLPMREPRFEYPDLNLDELLNFNQPNCSRPVRNLWQQLSGWLDSLSQFVGHGLALPFTDATWAMPLI